MKKAAMITGAALALLLIASMGAFAYGNGQGSVERGTYHEQMEELLESGSYADLEALRAETGMAMNPRIQSQEDFDAWAARHAEMEAEFGEGPHFGMNGMHDGSGRGMHGSKGGKGTGARDGSGMGRGIGHGQGQNGGGFNGECPYAN